MTANRTATGPEFSHAEDFTEFRFILYAVVILSGVGLLCGLFYGIRAMVDKVRKVDHLAEGEEFDEEALQKVEIIKSKDERGLVPTLARMKKGGHPETVPEVDSHVDKLRADPKIFVPDMNKFTTCGDQNFDSRMEAVRNEKLREKVLAIQKEEAQKVFRKFNEKQAQAKFEKRLKKESARRSEAPDSARPLASGDLDGDEEISDNKIMNKADACGHSNWNPTSTDKKINLLTLPTVQISESSRGSESGRRSRKKRRASVAVAAPSKELYQQPETRPRTLSIGVYSSAMQARIRQDALSIKNSAQLSYKSRINVENSFDSGNEPSREVSLSEISHLSKYVKPILEKRLASLGRSQQFLQQSQLQGFGKSPGTQLQSTLVIPSMEQGRLSVSQRRLSNDTGSLPSQPRSVTPVAVKIA